MRISTSSFIWSEKNEVIEQCLKNQEILDKIVKAVQAQIINQKLGMEQKDTDHTPMVRQHAKGGYDAMRWLLDEIPELRQHLIDLSKEGKIHYSQVAMTEVNIE